MKKINIELKKIKKAYGTQSVLKDITLSIDNGSYYAICGQSGAGKSTLMNILGLIEPFDEGQYVFNGQILKCSKDYSHIRKSYIGFIFQSYNLIPNISCRDNIIMPSLYIKEDRNILIKRFKELVYSMDISSLLDKKSNLLSGGEKQRVAIARALLLNPGLIIADEPTGNLDEKNKSIVLDILRKEHEKGRAIIMITHDEDTASMAEKKYMLENGILL
ncbi:ABC transporter ATP-binding protein [uncultured Eubacterium sp.]|uniref:ABC transporter ATP-binding protein n=1 Tax=uncultured Eubacterium sp. TaxID=165185 RepID=UPI002672C25E|nr:ABC transporter ATP-binding protein [uncultured Eubacterium sp.]